MSFKKNDRLFSSFRDKILKRIFFMFLQVCFILSSFSPFLYATAGEKAMVITSDPLATKTALEILKKGGNAIDAAVAAQWILNVVQPQASGIGGGGNLLFYDRTMKRILFFDGSVKAPDQSFAAMFLDEKGQLRPYRPDRNTGGLPVGVPGLLALLEEVHTQHGSRKFSFKELFDPAIQQAEKMTVVVEPLAQALREQKNRLALLEEAPLAYFKRGEPLKTGEKILQPDLAKTFRLIQKEGSRVFYKGEIAKAIIREVQKNTYRPGLLSARDLEQYKIVRRDSIHGVYQGLDLFTASPPVAGGVILLRELKILSHFGIAGFGKKAELFHLLAETQKIALSGKSSIADPDIFEISFGDLLSETWARQRSDSIKFDKIMKTVSSEKDTPEDHGKQDSSSILIVDPLGNIAVLTATLGDAFGSAAMVPGYGFFLNNQLTDFDADPNDMKDPDATNVPFAGQRPRSSDAPVLVFKQGQPVMVANAYGVNDPAAVITSLFLETFDFGGSCADAMRAPRVEDQNGLLQMEPGLYADQTLRTKLELSGQRVIKKEKIGIAQMIFFDVGSGKIEGESDPRGYGAAEGF